MSYIIHVGWISCLEGGSQFCYRIRWKQFGSTTITEVFIVLEAWLNKPLISTPKDEEGNEVTQRNDFKKVCHDSCNSLYKAHRVNYRQSKLRLGVLGSMPKKFIRAMNFKLLIFIKELYIVVNSMVKNKIHSLDGVGIKFYTFLWDLLIDEFFKMIVLAFDSFYELAYNIYFEVLLRLQTMLMEVVNVHQMIFLPL